MYHQWILTRLVVQLYRKICEPGLGYLAPAPIDTVLAEARCRTAGHCRNAGAGTMR